MSADTIARWNAIPQHRPDVSKDQQQNWKPPDDDHDIDMNGGDNHDGNDSDDDQSSILSRSPSPPPPDGDGTLSKYDEYIQGTTREVITIETKIKSTNKGFAMLTKLGWSEGQPLGLSGDGRLEPIPFQIKRDVTGLGKITQDVRMIETTVSQRRGLDSERQQKETEEQRRAREDSVARRAALQTQISSTLKAFYCTLCDKQFQTVAQYDEHTNSYAHHHKARFKDMQASQRLILKEEVDKRKEKERKREEKELRKIAAAAGVRMAKSSVQFTPTASSDAAPSTAQTETSGFKRSGWTSLSSSSTGSSSDPVGIQPTVKMPGWTSLPTEIPPPEPLRTTNVSNGSSRPAFPNSLPPAPTFRTAGWTSLDTTSPLTFPPPSPSASSTPPPVPPPPPMDPAPLLPPPPVPSGSRPFDKPQLRASVERNTTAQGQRPPPGDNRAPQPPPPPSRPPRPSSTATRGLSSWQQFKRDGPKRR